MSIINTKLFKRPKKYKSHEILTAINQSYDYELIAMCYHEAGHALCALFHFMKVFRMSVMRDHKQDGDTDYVVIDTNEVEDKILLKKLILFEIRTCFAGLVAERMYYKDISGSDKFPLNLKVQSGDDLKMASNLINKHDIVEPGKQRYEFKKQIQHDVKLLLTEFWEDVKLIAHYLHKKKRLNFDELKFLLTRRSKNKDFWKERFKKIYILLESKGDGLPDAEIKQIIKE